MVNGQTSFSSHRGPLSRGRQRSKQEIKIGKGNPKVSSAGKTPQSMAKAEAGAGGSRLLSLSPLPLSSSLLPIFLY